MSDLHGARPEANAVQLTAATAGAYVVSMAIRGIVPLAAVLVALVAYEAIHFAEARERLRRRLLHEVQNE